MHRSHAPSAARFGIRREDHRRYDPRQSRIATRVLRDAGTVAVDRPAVEAGLAVLQAGGDFADGIIAFEGRRLGGEVFVSFDRHAVELTVAGGAEARLLSAATVGAESSAYARISLPVPRIRICACATVIAAW
jgi:hypothetical protein